MKSRAAFILLIPLLFFSTKSFSQPDSCAVKISLLTVSPGTALYSAFGHSALRVADTVSHSDIVYNYGTFNFDEPGFYMKFIRGTLAFYLSTDNYDSFAYANKKDGRGTTEQVLNLTCAEKHKMIMLLQTNMATENRTYKYDVTFDNCTTRLRDLIEKSATGKVQFGNVLQSKKTFRDLIYEYLEKDDRQWSKLGIDILLGKPADTVMQPHEVMFLPDYLLATLNKTTINNKEIVSAKHQLYKVNEQPVLINYFTQPLFIFSYLFALICLLSFSKNGFVKRILFAFDGSMFFFVGLLGIFLIFMWFGTDHRMTKDNFNLLWAWPTNIVAAFYIHSKSKNAKGYFMLYAIFNLCLFAGWLFLPQHLNTALIPIIAILILRSILYIFTKNIG